MSIGFISQPSHLATGPGFINRVVLDWFLNLCTYNIHYKSVFVYCEYTQNISVYLCYIVHLTLVYFV